MPGRRQRVKEDENEESPAVSDEGLQLSRIPGASSLPLGVFELRDQGYVAEEYLFSGEASDYELRGAALRTGEWDARPGARKPFVTRLVVVRPEHAVRFSGEVVAEWLNVSAGGDSPAGWTVMHREIIRAGHAYIGVSTQKVAIDGGASLRLNARPLKTIDPQRYSNLNHPGDAYAFDLFARAGLALRRDGHSLLGAPVKRLVAFGASQSAFFLTTFINAVAPFHRPFDGYLIQGRFAGVAALTDPDIFGEGAYSCVHFRTDQPEPILLVESETDVIGTGIKQGGYATARQSHAERLVVWEVAGSAHLDLSIFAVGDVDTDAISTKTRASAWRPRFNLLGQVLQVPLNSAPQQYYVMNAALRRLFEWIDQGRKPPAAPPLTIEQEHASYIRLRRDRSGLACGGVRSPWADAPLSAHSGLPNSAGMMGALIGQSRPFDRVMIDRLYPGGHEEYLATFAKALDQAVGDGFILAENRAEILALGEQNWTWAMEVTR